MVMMRLLHSLLLLSLFFLPLCVISDKPPKILVGGWTPLTNIEDPHVTEIANFAVAEYDNKHGAKLKLEKVIKGETQVVAGTNYRLVLAVDDGSSSTKKNYEAVVWEKPWEHLRKLISFNPVQA